MSAVPLQIFVLRHTRLVCMDQRLFGLSLDISKQTSGKKIWRMLTAPSKKWNRLQKECFWWSSVIETRHIKLASPMFPVCKKEYELSKYKNKYLKLEFKWIKRSDYIPCSMIDVFCNNLLYLNIWICFSWRLVRYISKSSWLQSSICRLWWHWR